MNIIIAGIFLIFGLIGILIILTGAILLVGIFCPFQIKNLWKKSKEKVPKACSDKKIKITIKGGRVLQYDNLSEIPEWVKKTSDL